MYLQGFFHDRIAFAHDLRVIRLRNSDAYSFEA